MDMLVVNKVKGLGIHLLVFGTRLAWPQMDLAIINEDHLTSGPHHSYIGLVTN